MQQRSRFRSWCFPISLLVGLSAVDARMAAQDAPKGAAPLETAVRSAYREGQDGRPDDEIAFVLGNVEYLLVHEIAHFLIAEKDIPIIGPVENAADYIATLALIREEPLDPMQKDRAEKFLLEAAKAFAASWQVGTTLGAEVPYWGEHALSIQRYYQIACLLYGSDTHAFASVPRNAGMPEARAQSCIAEYARAARAVDWLLLNYGRRPGDGPGAATEIVYERPPTLVSTKVLQALKSIQLVERVVGRLHERFTLDRPSRLVLRSCGRSEAAWIPDTRELVVCYELIDALYVLGRRAKGMKLSDPPGAPDQSDR